jgi:hypothetical protein
MTISSHAEICLLVGYYAASSSNPLPTFRDNVSFPSSRVKKSKKKIKPDYHAKLLNTPEERRSHQYRGGSLKFFFHVVANKCKRKGILIYIPFPINTHSLNPTNKLTEAEVKEPSHR